MATTVSRTTETPRVLRLHEVCSICGLSSSTIRRREGRGDFPERIDLGGNAIGWLESEVLAWLESRERGTRRNQRTAR